ncbi:glycosyltransferase [Nocardia sp. NPDC046763]|uniref:glycosyltransferase n=1 Tax=Nocardia sp. NPDC046763 TaxID=3155256 RepID=UPI0033E3B4D8
MSRIILVGIGSRGDIAPLTGLGVGLRDAGHEVVVASHWMFAEQITGCGLEFRQMPLNIDIDTTDTDINRLAAGWKFSSPSGVRSMGRGMIEALLDEPADVLLLPPTEYAGLPLAEAKGIPAIGLRFQPLSATAAHAPAALGAYDFGARGNRLAGDFGAWFNDRFYARTIAGFRRELGLPPTSAFDLRRGRTAAEWPILNGFSPSVVPRPGDWRPGLEVTGYWWPPRPDDWQPPADLVDFLDAGPAPVFLGFGSMVDSAEGSARMSAIIGAALRRAGVRGIVQTGWLQLDIAGDDVLTIGEVPHDWLFPHMSALVHHCGAGTTAAGLRAGVPAIGAPVYADQPFWAQRLIDAGVSPATIPYSKMSGDRLTAALRRATTDTALRDNATRLAARIAAEDGVGLAVKAIEAHLAAHRKG